MSSSSAYPPIADHAIVGDCHTAALVSRDGYVDWLCPGRFDAPAVFCRLLDSRKGGYLRTMPLDTFTSQRTYRGATNVLDTTFTTDGGRVRITDLMPIHRRQSERRGYDVGTSQRFLRCIEGLDGQVELELEFKPTFDFARARAELRLQPGGGVIAQVGAQFLTMSCPEPLSVTESGCATGRIRVRPGERSWIVLTFATDPDRAAEALAPANCEHQLARTLEYWEHWAAQCRYDGPYREHVVRSALVLKLLTYEPSGALVAAPTTSLPEEIGGQRNWDYRFTWLRDSSLILYALMTIGYDDEAADFIHWLEQTIGADPTATPQIMYGIDSRRKLPEQVLDHLEGYCDSRPVRIGNAAADQRQLDIYGEVLRAASLHYRAGHAHPRQAWPVLKGLVEQARQRWTESGHGIWEVRGGPRNFTYGKLMCWAALDVGVRLAREHALDAPLDEWIRVRDEIRQCVMQRAWSSKVGAFTQSFDSSTVDASALIIPRIGFLPPKDPRVVSTVTRIKRDLTHNGLVYRYRTPDGLPGGEGTFTLCTFWRADALALTGELADAHTLFCRALGVANDVGLLAEEVDPETGQQVGNFPQGFSHLALIGCAVDLAKAEARGGEQEAHTEAQRART